MRIGVITLWGTKNNYGQVLQTYALQTFLKGRGHDTFLIKYKPGRKNIKEQLLSFFPNPLKRAVHLLGKWRTRKEKILGEEFAKRTPRYFDEFTKQHISAYPKEYVRLQSITSDPPEADVYITGSDQVWTSYDWIEEYAPYYLRFGGRDVKRISYAASFGRDEISKQKMREMKVLLETYSGVSVRELSGLELCRRMGLKEVAQLVDPTMLLPESQYVSLLEGQRIDKWEAKKRVFCYFLNFQSGKDIFWDEVRKLSEDKDTSLRCVISSGSLPAYDRLGFDGYYSPDIYNWIYSIKEADYVITNSFHGLVFSLLFHKNFSVALLHGKTSAMNNRITSLLDEVGLKSRMLNDKNDIYRTRNEDIDWGKVDAYLSIKRSEASSFFFRNGI